MLARRLGAEFVGTAFLLMGVVGSGIAAENLSPDDVGLQFLENSIATAGVLLIIIWVFAAVSDAHFNPAVTLAFTAVDGMAKKLAVGLLMVIFGLVKAGKELLVAPAVAAYIGAAYFFTSSTSFANPAVTVRRMFTDTFAGIEPASAPAFIVAQLVGTALVVGFVIWMWATPRSEAS